MFSVYSFTVTVGDNISNNYLFGIGYFALTFLFSLFLFNVLLWRKKDIALFWDLFVYNVLVIFECHIFTFTFTMDMIVTNDELFCTKVKTELVENLFFNFDVLSLSSDSFKFLLNYCSQNFKTSKHHLKCLMYSFVGKKLLWVLTSRVIFFFDLHLHLLRKMFSGHA